MRLVMKFVLGADAGALDVLKANNTLLTDTDTDALARLRTWTTQPGYPVLNVSETNTIQQARFYSYGSEVRNDTYMTDHSSSWYVPLQVGTSPSAAVATAALTSGSNHQTYVELLQQQQVQVNLTGPLVNQASFSYYRQALSAAVMQLLACLGCSTPQPVFSVHIFSMIHCVRLNEQQLQSGVTP